LFDNEPIGVSLTALAFDTIDLTAVGADHVDPVLRSRSVTVVIKGAADPKLTRRYDDIIGVSTTRGRVNLAGLRAIDTDEVRPGLDPCLVTGTVELSALAKCALVHHLTICDTLTRLLVILVRGRPIDADNQDARLLTSLVTGAVEAATITKLTRVDDLSVCLSKAVSVLILLSASPIDADLVGPPLRAALVADVTKTNALAEASFVNHDAVSIPDTLLCLDLVAPDTVSADHGRARPGAALAAFALETAAIAKIALRDHLTVGVPRAHPVFDLGRLFPVETDSVRALLVAALIASVIESTFAECAFFYDLTIGVAFTSLLVILIGGSAIDADDQDARLLSRLVTGAVKAAALTKLTRVDDFSVCIPATVSVLLLLCGLSIDTDQVGPALRAALITEVIKSAALAEDSFLYYDAIGVSGTLLCLDLVAPDAVPADHGRT
jgi:uncharacterized membrane protein (DUF441 family)